MEREPQGLKLRIIEIGGFNLKVIEDESQGSYCI